MAKGKKGEQNAKTALAGVDIEAERGTYFKINPDDKRLVIVTDPKDPLYDVRGTWAPTEEMILSVGTYGVQETILVRKRDDKLIVVDGRQRVNSSRKWNTPAYYKKHKGEKITKIPAMVVTVSEDMCVGIQATCNIHLPESTGSRLEKLEGLINLGRTDDQAAVALGVKPSWIKQAKIALEKCSRSVLSKLRKDDINLSVAVQIAALSQAEQGEKLAEMIKAGGKVTVERAKKAAKREKITEGPKWKPRKEVASMATTIQIAVEKARDPKSDVALDDLHALEGAAKVFAWLSGGEENLGGLEDLLKLVLPVEPVADVVAAKEKKGKGRRKGKVNAAVDADAVETQSTEAEDVEPVESEKVVVEKADKSGGRLRRTVFGALDSALQNNGREMLDDDMSDTALAADVIDRDNDVAELTDSSDEPIKLVVPFVREWRAMQSRATA